MLADNTFLLQGRELYLARTVGGKIIIITLLFILFYIIIIHYMRAEVGPGALGSYIWTSSFTSQHLLGKFDKFFFYGQQPTQRWVQTISSEHFLHTTRP